MAKTFEVKYFKGNVTDNIKGLTVTNTGNVTINKGEKGQYLNLSNGKYLTYSDTPLPTSGALSVVAFARCPSNFAVGSPRQLAILSDTTSGTARSFSIGMSTALNRATIDMASPNYRTFVWTQDYKWHCFVFTLPGSETTSISTSAFYVDGIAQATSSTATGALGARTDIKIVGGTSVGKGADVAYLAVHDTVLTQQEIDAYVAQFNSFIGFDKPKRGFLMNKPNDLSKYVGSGSTQGLTAAYNMKPNGLTLTDISGNGYNGTLGDNIVSTQDGLMANGSINGLLIRDGAIITTNDHSIIGRIKLNTLMSGDGVLFTNDNTTANTIVDSIGISNGKISWNYDPSGTYKNGSTRTLDVGRWYDFALTLSGGRTGTVKLYIDGVEDTITSTTYYRSGGDVKLFNRSGGSIPFYGECSDFRVYNRALTLQEVKDYHNSFAKQPYLVEDFSDIPADGNAIVPREWIKTSGSFKGGEINLTQGNLIPNGYFESGITGYGLTAGTGGNATLSYETTSPITGVGSLRVTQTTQPSEAFRPHLTIALTKTTELDKTYSVRFKSRLLSGAVKFSAGNGVQLGLASSRAHLVDQVFSGSQQWSVTVKSTAVGTNMFMYFNGSLSAFDLLLDDIEVVEIPPLPTLTKGSKYIECVTAGVLAIPSTQAFGTWEWDWYKGADANTSKYNFIAPNLNGDGVSSMTFYVDNSENFLLRASNSTIASTAAAYLQNFTWYRVKVTRTSSGVWTMLIKGGNFVPTAGYNGYTLISVSGGTGTNPITSTAISTSLYFLTDMDAGDRLTNIKLTNGVIV